MISGTALLAVPFSFAVYGIAKRTRRLIVSVGVICVGYAIFIATSPPGNLMFVGLVFALALAIGLLWLAGFAFRRFAKPPDA